jgi:hypothetical protein
MILRAHDATRRRSFDPFEDHVMMTVEDTRDDAGTRVSVRNIGTGLRVQQTVAELTNLKWFTLGGLLHDRSGH